MPAGNSTARPYNRSTKEIASAKRKLAARTANASRNAQSRIAGEKYNDDRADTPSNAKVGRGIFGANDVGPSDDALQAIRNIGAREDNKAANKLRSKADQKELERTSAAKETARIKDEDEVIKAMGKDFKGAKGGKISKNGITRMRTGGKIRGYGKARGGKACKMR